LVCFHPPVTVIISAVTTDRIAGVCGRVLTCSELIFTSHHSELKKLKNNGTALAQKNASSPFTQETTTMHSTRTNPLLSALRTLPLSETEKRSILLKLEKSNAPLSETSKRLAQELVALPNKKSISLETLFTTFQEWAQSQLDANDMVLLHHAVQPTLLGGTTHFGITIVCNSQTRTQRLEHAAQLLLASILGYFRFPIALRFCTTHEVSPRMFKSATILIHGKEDNFSSLQQATNKTLNKAH
jgi:hypothetical protein